MIEPELSHAELLTAQAMQADSPMTVAVALSYPGDWPAAHVDTARRAIRARHAELTAQGYGRTDGYGGELMEGGF